MPRMNNLDFFSAISDGLCDRSSGRLAQYLSKRVFVLDRQLCEKCVEVGVEGEGASAVGFWDEGGQGCGRVEGDVEVGEEGGG